MENKSHAIAAGVFVLVLIFLLGALAVFLTRDHGKYQIYELSTPQTVTGLQIQSAVHYKGVSVGKVEYIGFDPHAAGNVLIRISVAVGTPIESTTFASLGYQGVTGMAHIDLDDAATPFPKQGLSPDGYRRLPMRRSGLSQLAQLGPEVFGEARETMAGLRQLLDEENRKEMIEAITNIGNAAASANELMQNINHSWVHEVDPLMKQLHSGLGGNMKSMQRATDSVDRLARDMDGLARRIGEQGGALDQVEKTARTFSNVAQEVSIGTMPRLQRTLDEISATMREISTLTRTIDENPQSFLFGPNSSRPGPGESGYVAPAQ